MMRLRNYALLAVSIAAALTLSAQAPAKRTAAQVKALSDQHHGDFDYLLGDWGFTSVSKQYGQGKGYWSAVRLPGGELMDEFRVVSDTGETYHVTATIRAYNAAWDRWDLISMGGAGGLQDVGTGQRVGQEVHIEQTFGATS